MKSLNSATDKFCVFSMAEKERSTHGYTRMPDYVLEPFSYFKNHLYQA